MVDEVITKQELINAKRDARDLGKAVNEKVIVSPRYGEDFKSLPMIAAEAQTAINEWQDAINTITVNDGVPALAVSDASGKTQQEINDNQKKINNRFVTAKDYFAVGDGALRPVSDLYTMGSVAYNSKFSNFLDVQSVLTAATDPSAPLDWCALQSAANDQGTKYKTSLLLGGGDYNIGSKTLHFKKSIGIVGSLNLSLGIARITYSGTGSAVKFKKDNYDSGVPATWIYAPIFTSINIVGIGGNADTALELWGVSEGNFDKVSLGGTTISKFKTGVKMHKCSILNFDKMIASYIDTLFDFAEDGFSRWNTTAAVNIQNGDFYDIRTVFKCNSVSGLNAFTNWIESCDNVFLFDDTGSELITAENIRTFSNNCVMNTASSQKIVKVKNGAGRQSRVLSTSFGKNILRYTNDESNTQAAYDFDVAGTEAINLFDFSFSENDYFGKSSAVANANNLKVRLKFIENNNYHASTSNLNIPDTLPSSVFTGSIETTVNSAKVFGRTNKLRSGATVIIDDQNGSASSLYIYAKSGQVAPLLSFFATSGAPLSSVNADGSVFTNYIKLQTNSLRNLNGTPTSGSYVVGDRVLNSEPSISKPVTEWTCISASPLTWQQSAHLVYKGTTAQRPVLLLRDQGVQYFDTTLAANGKPIWWTGSAWVDALGVAV